MNEKSETRHTFHLCIKPKKRSSLSLKNCSRIKRCIMRKISYEDFVSDLDHEDENVDDYGGIVMVDGSGGGGCRSDNVA